MRESVVVVGAGIDGLDGAVYAQHTLPGGYVLSFERGSCVFPTGPTLSGSKGDGSRTSTRSVTRSSTGAASRRR